MSQKEIHYNFIKTLGDESPFYSMMKKWAAEFRKGRENMEEYVWSGHPKQATTDKNVELVHSLIMCDRRRSLHDIASQIDIGFGALQSILTDTSRMSQLDGVDVFCSCKIMHQPTTLKLLWLLQINATCGSFSSSVFPRSGPLGRLSVSKSNLPGRNFRSNEGIDVVDEYFGDQVEGFYFEGISKLEQHLRKCIEAKGVF